MRSSRDATPVAAHGRVTGVRATVVSAAIEAGAVRRNEIADIVAAGTRLQAEVLRIRDGGCELQVFEDTRGVAVGDAVEFSGELLAAQLGPGLLGQVFDGLLKPLPALATSDGLFLRRGARAPTLDADRRWTFDPLVKAGQMIFAGDAIGSVRERNLTHRILAPARIGASAQVRWIERGAFRVDDPIGEVLGADGRNHVLTLAQRWPVRVPFVEPLVHARRAERVLPSALLCTGQRVIDTFFPIALGGTACMPGPFGAGKTVLQGLIARFAAADVVVVVACGERAGEVVELINELPKLPDPRSGGVLADRTVIICNTSSMPVAAREASIYAGVTVGEYYRQMGLDVLLLADSTSRWAQALRETSGQMEEIPGDEAYPAYLDSTIRALYERAGVIVCPDGRRGSLTLLGSVSPAGGNLEEPVTQATLNAVKTFLALSADRAYRRAFPAIDPLLSWSRYRAQIAASVRDALGADWSARADRVLALLRRAHSIDQLIEVTGEEGVTLEDFVVREQAAFVDAVYLQQDGFDPIDRASSFARARFALDIVHTVIDAPLRFASKEACRSRFAALTSMVKNLNYSAEASEAFERYRREIGALLAQD